MSLLLDHQDVDRKPVFALAALAVAAAPTEPTEPTSLPAPDRALQPPPAPAPVADVQPVESTSQVSLDLYGRGAQASGAATDAAMNDSATEDGELDEQPGGNGRRSEDDEEEDEEEEDDESSDEEALRAVQRRQGQARRMEAVQGLYPGEQVLPDEEFGTKTVGGAYIHIASCCSYRTEDAFVRCTEIYAMLDANVINLSPDYQRDVVVRSLHPVPLFIPLLLTGPAQPLVPYPNRLHACLHSH